MPYNWLPASEIGARVREIRAALGLTQKELAGHIGRPGSQSEISLIERGRKQPDAALLLDVASLAGRSLDHFHEDGTDPHQWVRAEMLVAAKWMERMAEHLREEVRSSRSKAVADSTGAEASADSRTPGTTEYASSRESREGSAE
jgi:transcriptional regulator with XRE-family HTH domain